MNHPIYPLKEEDEYFFDEGCHILEVLNTPGDPDVSIVRSRVEPGVTTRWHRLRGTAERYLIQAGIGDAYVGDGPSHRVAAGDVVLIPADVRQRIHNPGDSDLVFMAICSPRFTRDAYVDDEG
ncbi:MAG: cupin domain-containing protein [Pseudomonadota bacterium]